jgi:hypothetical protein
MEGTLYRGWRQPLVPWSPRQPLWAGSNTHAGLILLQYSNTPRSHNSATADVETKPKLIKYHGGESLREDVGELRCHRDMKDADLTNDNLLSDKMKINFYMLDALMPNGVGA